MNLKSSAYALVALLAGTAGASAAVLVTQWLLTRVLPIADYGKLAASLAAVNLATPVASMGLNWFWLQAFGREGASAYRWIPASLRLFALALAVSTGGYGLYVYASSGAPSDRLWLIFLCGAAVLWGQAFVEIGSARLQMEERYGALSLWQSSAQFGRFAFTALLALAGLATLPTIFIVYAAIGLITAAIGFKFLSDVAGQHLTLTGVRGSTGSVALTGVSETLREASPFALITVFYLIYFQSVVLLIDVFLGPEQAATFNVALLVVASFNLLPNVVFQKFLIPKLCRWAETDSNKLNLVTNATALALGSIGLALAIALVFLSPLIIRLLFGPGYNMSAPILAGLALTIPLRFVQSAYSAVFIDPKQMRIKVVYSGVSAGLCVVLNVALLPTLGTSGGVFAAVAAEATLLVLFLFGVRRHVPAVDPRLAQDLRTLRQSIKGTQAPELRGQ